MDVETPQPGEPQEEQEGKKASFYDSPYTLGLYAAHDYSPEPFIEFTEPTLSKVKSYVEICSRTDVAARRFEVEQTWEARLFYRGYQHLVPQQRGGFALPQTARWGPIASADQAGLYSMNIYGRDGEIIIGALSREIPQVEFFPCSPDKAEDLGAAEEANKFKDYYAKNNDLRERLTEIARYFYTDDRVLLYTRYVKDAQRFGFEEPDSDDDVPEATGTDQAQDSPTSEPAGCEITTVYGKLEHKVPITVQSEHSMHFAQIYEEVDIALAKAECPWIADKIKPGSAGIGEVELDKLARMNTKLALLGSYVTDDTFKRDVTRQMTWLRPSCYFDETFDEEARKELIEKAPKGLLVKFMGKDFAFARNEAFDDHLKIVHAFPEDGQNRRAIGSNDIPVQKRVNKWMDLMDMFFCATIPKKWMDSQAFDVQALKNQTNNPGEIGPFERQPGVPVGELIFVEPTPSHQPALPEFIQWFANEFSGDLVGALPSLYGGSDNSDAESGAAIGMKRDQALGRIGTPWNSIKSAFQMVFKQAVMCAAECRENNISATLPEKGYVSIDVNKLKGNTVCYAEYDSSFPESWTQRENRYVELVSNAALNPFYATMLKSPKNMRAIANNVRMADLEVPGEDASEKQLGEIAVLKATAPLDNPQKAMAEQQMTASKEAARQDALSGQPIPPEAQQVADQMQKQIDALPDQVPSIQVRQDKSENHEIEAATCFEWMNGDEGRKFLNGTPEEKAGWQNVYLHWQQHQAMVDKLAQQNAPQPKPPSMSISVDKMPAEVQAQALSKEGIQATPDMFLKDDLREVKKKELENASAPKPAPIPTMGRQ